MWIFNSLNQTLLAHGFDLALIWQRLIYWLDIMWFVCLFFTVIFLAGIIYFTQKVMAIRRFETEKVYGKKSLTEEIKEDLAIVPPERNSDWAKITKLIGSDNPNDWQLAIIEADKILELVVDTFKMPGDNMGDKLKKIEKSDFNTLDGAWQAHKVRNQIAHEHNFHLSQRDARIAIDNFEKVFKEFDFI